MSNVTVSFLVPASAPWANISMGGTLTWTSNQGLEDGLWAGRRGPGKAPLLGKCRRAQRQKVKGWASLKHHSQFYAAGNVGHCFLTSERNQVQADVTHGHSRRDLSSGDAPGSRVVLESGEPMRPTSNCINTLRRWGSAESLSIGRRTSRGPADR